MANMPARPTLCIVATNRQAYTETFIHHHFARLPARVVPLYGRHLFNLEAADGWLLADISVGRLARWLMTQRRIPRTPEAIAQMALKQFLIDNRVEVVLAEYGVTGVLMVDACRELDVPLVVHFHGNDAYGRKVLENQGKRYPELFRVARAVIAVSRHMEQQLVALGAPPEKVVYNPYGVDAQKFAAAQPERAGPEFLAVGRFVDKKAPDLTIHAFREVLSQVPEARLRMIGDGPLLDVCRRLVSADGPGRCCRVPGYPAARCRGPAAAEGPGPLSSIR
jgi:colanic acid/amylovoran biosynthesis glycosyltransferase